jgi:hypothetical protein
MKYAAGLFYVRRRLVHNTLIARSKQTAVLTSRVFIKTIALAAEAMPSIWLVAR